MIRLITILFTLFSSSAFSADQLQYSAEIKPGEKSAALRLLLNFHIERGPGVQFDDLLAIIRETDLGNRIGNELISYRPFPMNLLKSEIEFKKNGNDPKKFSYIIHAWMKVLPRFVTLESTKLDCIENVLNSNSGRNWSMSCAIDLKYGDGDEYFTAYAQAASCSEVGSAIQCKVEVSSGHKRIDVPGVAKPFMNGIKFYSPSQAAHKFAENVLHGYFVASHLIRLPKPYPAKVKQAIQSFEAGPYKKDLDAWLKTYPVSTNDLKPITLSN